MRRFSNQAGPGGAQGRVNVVQIEPARSEGLLSVVAAFSGLGTDGGDKQLTAVVARPEGSACMPTSRLDADKQAADCSSGLARRVKSPLPAPGGQLDVP